MSLEALITNSEATIFFGELILIVTKLSKLTLQEKYLRLEKVQPCKLLIISGLLCLEVSIQIKLKFITVFISTTLPAGLGTNVQEPTSHSYSRDTTLLFVHSKVPSISSGDLTATQINKNSTSTISTQSRPRLHLGPKSQLRAYIHLQYLRQEQDIASFL